LTLPTRGLTGQATISSDEKGASMALSWGASAGSSPNQIAAENACSSATNSLADAREADQDRDNFGALGEGK
jgi:uncharacterized protein (TIGR02246 family)